MASKFVAVLLLTFAVSSFSNVISPASKASDLGAEKRLQEAAVTITVGEKPNFLYTANGYTNSNQKVTVSGKYLNDEINGKGYANLFLVVESGINFNTLRPYVVDNTLRVDVLNYYDQLFEFQILVPYPVIVQRDVGTFRFNDTAILITGPSRSFFFPSSKSAAAVKNFNIKPQGLTAA